MENKFKLLNDDKAKCLSDICFDNFILTNEEVIKILNGAKIEVIK